MNCVRLCTVRHPRRGASGARPAWGPSPKLRVYTQSGRVFRLRILPRVLQKALCSSLAAPALDRATDALRARLARVGASPPLGFRALPAPPYGFLHLRAETAMA